MHEILFRGKSPITQKWVYGDLFQHGEQRFIVADKINTEVLPETVGQYTGVNDIDGVRIFEGDIVKNIVTDLICVVARDNYYAGFVINKNKDSKTQFSLSKASGRAQKVIGNIHDNPEMLEAGKENT